MKNTTFTASERDASLQEMQSEEKEVCTHG